MTGPSVSVVVPTFRRRESTLAAVRSLCGQDHPPELLEVIVVDDGSDDGTAAAVEALGATARVRVRVLRHEQNRGPAAARNTGLAAAEGVVVAFTDSDCAADPGWVRAGVDALAPDVVVVQGRTRPADGGSAAGWSYTQDIADLTGRFETCNVFYRTAELRAVGGFPEAIGNFGEDVVAGWRVLRGGGRAVYAPDAVVEHAVTHPGFRWFLRWARLYRNWPATVRTVPELRRELLVGRVFLRPRDAALVLAVVGLVLAVRWRPAVLLAVPYAWTRRPRHATVGAVGEAAQLVLFDLATLRALVAGSVEHRTLVL